MKVSYLHLKDDIYPSELVVWIFSAKRVGSELYLQDLHLALTLS